MSVKKLGGVVIPSEALPREVAGILAAYKKSMPGFALSSSGSMMLSGVPARYLSAPYRLTATGAVWKTREVIAVRVRLRTANTCAAPAAGFAGEKQSFDRVLASVRFGAAELPAYRAGVRAARGQAVSVYRPVSGHRPRSVRRRVSEDGQSLRWKNRSGIDWSAHGWAPFVRAGMRNNDVNQPETGWSGRTG